MLARDHADLRPQFLAQAGEWVRSGRLTYRETIAEGIESTAQAFIDMLSGAKTGKILVRLKCLTNGPPRTTSASPDRPSPGGIRRPITACNCR